MKELDISKEVQTLKLDNVSNLPLDTQMKVLAQILGYREMPVDIDTFLDDPYYMGDLAKNLFPFWRRVLKDIFPTALHTSTPILVFTGAIGTGKSTAVRFMAEYMKHRIACLRNPYDTFGFVPGKPLKFSFFHKSKDLAQSDFLSVIDSWEDVSPYFKTINKAGTLDLIESVGDSVRSNANIGSDVLFYNLSELNFIKFDQAHEKLDQALKRWYSRFERLTRYFGMVIIDTSAQGDDSIADYFIANNPYGKMVRAIHTNTWKVRDHLNYYGEKGWFKVFLGDGVHSPFIVKPELGRVITNDMDQDRVLDVPEEVRANFEFNLETALQDIAGVSINASDRFFPSTTELNKCFSQPQYGPDVVKFDFFDKTDKLIYRFDRSLQRIPEDKIIYIRYDIGVTGDNTGLAIAYFDKWRVYDWNKKIRQPEIIIPLAIGINRYEGTETPIYHLFEFLMDLNNKFEIGRFSADQFASRQLLQDLTREGIKNKYLSVDRTDEAYVFTKTLANNGLLSMPNNELLRNELADLRRVGNKIDHPATGCFVKCTRVICSNLEGDIVIKTIGSLLDTYEDYLILSYDRKSEIFEFVGIKKVFFTKSVKKLSHLEFDNEHSYYCTVNHLFLTRGGYVEAHKLDPTYEVIGEPEGTKITCNRIITTASPVDVYDIEVDSNNSNFCLSNGVVVHNSKDIADAVSGVVFDLYSDIKVAGQLSNKYRVQNYSKFMEDRSRRDDNHFQDMLGGIY